MSGALAGIRVLDFSRLLPGPYCTWLLADMGAEVIRVENPREVAKQAQVFGWDRLPPAERGALREGDILARNKRSVMLDIGDPVAQDALRALAARADVVVEDYRPGVLDGLGLGAAALRGQNPRLVYASLTLCGQTGPYRDKPGHDPVALAIAGVLSRVGENPDVPSFPGVPVADVVTGAHAAFAVLAALRARDHSGQGQHLDVAMSDCAMSLLVNVLSRHPDPATAPPRGTRRADMGLWRTSDGQFLCTTDMEPRYWRRFCAAVGRPDFVPLQNEIAARPRIRAELEAIFASRTLAEWETTLGTAGTQFAPVHDIPAALADPHNRARGMVLDLPGSDGRPRRQLGPPVRLDDQPRSHRLGRAPGADTEAVLRDLGFDDATITVLSRQGARGRSA
ncbi:CaiB/BaiF CoA transferase family protein [Plastorhodobacter daqingensis]|uniref:CaiB/BaiF CoA transferase family protein n=1 Tax=Plastorhodobacter daqingensis TaxID=1387281 RepID=A0ABW2UKK0_9RHOB